MKAATDALDNAVLNSAHWRAWFSAAMGIFLDGFDLFIIAVALPLIHVQFSTGPVVLGLIGAAAPLGCIIGSAFVGRYTDKLGRRAILLFDVFFFVFFAGLSALSWSVESLIVFRFLLGIGIGADYPVSSTYVTETMPKRLRGRMMVGGFGFQALGALAGAGLGVIVLKVYPEPDAWRFMLGAGVLPAIFVLWLRARLPESPRWLLERGDHEKASEAAAYMTGTALQKPARIRKKSASEESKFSDLFTRRYIKRTLLTSLSWFLMDIGFYGIGFFTPMILAAMAFTTKGDFIEQAISSTKGAVFADLFLVFGILMAVWLVEKWGRIKLQAIGFLGMAAGLFILSISHFFIGTEWHLFVVFSGFILFNILVNMGPNPTTFLLPAELFPTHLRATGHGFASACGKVGAAVGIFLLPIFEHQIGLPVTMFIIGVACVAGFVITVTLGTETKGRSIDDIDLVEVAMDHAEVELLHVQKDIKRLNADIGRVEDALARAIEEMRRVTRH